MNCYLDVKENTARCCYYEDEDPKRAWDVGYTVKWRTDLCKRLNGTAPRLYTSNRQPRTKFRIPRAICTEPPFVSSARLDTEVRGRTRNICWWYQNWRSDGIRCTRSPVVARAMSVRKIFTRMREETRRVCEWCEGGGDKGREVVSSRMIGIWRGRLKKEV